MISVIDAYGAAKNGTTLTGWTVYHGVHIGVGTDPEDDVVRVWPSADPDAETTFDVDCTPTAFEDAVADFVTEAM